MRFSRGIGINLKAPSVRIGAIFFFGTLLFVSAFLCLEYKAYLSNYEQTQRQETSLLQEKIKTSFDRLQGLSSLTAKRIAASRQDLRRIQRVLGSLHQFFPEYTFPRIQMVSFHKLSPASARVTRFGTLPLDPTASSPKGLSQATPTITVGKNAVASKMLVFSEKNILQGILEIEIDLAELKKSLGGWKTLVLSVGQNASLIQKASLPIYALPPNTLKQFLMAHSPYYYGIFLSYMMLCLIFIPLSVEILDRRRKNRESDERKALETTVAQLAITIQRQEEAIHAFQQTQSSQKISDKNYQDFRASLSSRHKAGGDFITKSLDVLEQSFNTPHMHIPDKKQVEILQACKNESRPLSGGVIAEVSNDPIDIKEMLHNTYELFTAKIHESNLVVDIICSKTLAFTGDPILLRLLLTTLVGRPIYKAPRNGRIEVRAKILKTALHIEVRDNNGSPYSEKAERLIKKSFDLFMTRDDFEQCCRERKLLYTHSKDGKGHNVSKLVVPVLKTTTGASNTNVVPLFR